MRIFYTVEHKGRKVSIDKLIATILWATIPLFTIFGAPFLIDWYKSLGIDKSTILLAMGILSIATVVIITRPIDIWR